MSVAISMCVMPIIKGSRVSILGLGCTCTLHYPHSVATVVLEPTPPFSFAPFLHHTHFFSTHTSLLLSQLPTSPFWPQHVVLHTPLPCSRPSHPVSPTGDAEPGQDGWGHGQDHGGCQPTDEGGGHTEDDDEL